MRKFLLLLGLAVLPLLARAAASPLVTPAELQALLKTGEVRVVDVREEQAYALQHVPGAVSAPYGDWRGPDSNPGEVPPLAELTDLVQGLGLTPDLRTVIVYTGTDSTDFGSAARVYWTLKSLGAQNLAILNGGLAAWKRAGLPVASQPGQAGRSAWQPRWDGRWTATRAQVRGDLGHGAVLVDSRPAPFFQGRMKHGAARALGTLPGATNLDSDLFFEPGAAALMDRASLATEADALPAQGHQPTVAFCNTGHWAATDWFVLSEVLGRPGVQLYPGSMVDWTQSPEPLPMANEPTRWAQLRYQWMNWSHRNLGTQAP